jgi:hypothetical protein
VTEALAPLHAPRPPKSSIPPFGRNCSAEGE